MFLSKILGPVRRLIVPDHSEGEPGQSPTVNNRGELLVAQALPQRTEIVRLGNSWHCSIATGSAFTHVAAWPTTRAEIVLYNGEAAGAVGSKSYIIDSLWYANVATSVAAATTGTFLAQIVPGPVTAPTDDTAQLITSLSGRGTNYGGKARRAVANTAFMVASKWQVFGQFGSGGATATIGMGCYIDVYGHLIVPPGAVLGLNVVVGTATGTGSIGVSWHEAFLPLG